MSVDAQSDVQAINVLSSDTPGNSNRKIGRLVNLVRFSSCHVEGRRSYLSNRTAFAVVPTFLRNTQPRLRGAFFLSLRFPSVDKEIFHDERAIHRREWLLAGPATDQSMREVGVSFHAHHLVARPAAGADKLSRIVFSHCGPPGK